MQIKSQSLTIAFKRRDVADDKMLGHIQLGVDVEGTLVQMICLEPRQIGIGHGLDQADAQNARQIVFDLQGFDVIVELGRRDLFRGQDKCGHSGQAVQIAVDARVQRLDPVRRQAAEFLCGGALGCFIAQRGHTDGYQYEQSNQKNIKLAH